jgi:hypothetical protein
VLSMCGVPTTMAHGKTTLRRDAKSIKKIANEAVYQHVSSRADEKYVGQRKAIALRFRQKIQLGRPQEDLRKQAPTPHMRAFEVKHPDRRSGGARSLHTAACRHGRRGQGLASGDLCSCSLHHLISGRTGMVRTHIPHACGKEATRITSVSRQGIACIG